MTLIIGSLQLGLIYGLLALGVYITFRILNLPDLTVEGSFTLGLAVSAALTMKGHPILGIVLGIAAGAGAGVLTGLFQTVFRIHPILAGILTMSGLYSINLMIMGSSSNLTLIGHDTLFQMLYQAFPGVGKDIVKAALALAFCLVFFLLLSWFFKTHLGLCIRATGDNESMVRASSINVQATKIIALAVANAMVALSGAVLAQYQGFADIGSGVGILVVGLASVIIGDVIFGKRSVTAGFLSAMAGSLIYRFIIAIAINTSIFPAYMLKLVSALIVFLALSLPAIKSMISFQKAKSRAKKQAGKEEESYAHAE